jgi:hypothetical protein
MLLQVTKMLAPQVPSSSNTQNSLQCGDEAAQYDSTYHTIQAMAPKKALEGDDSKDDETKDDACIYGSGFMDVSSHILIIIC